MKLSVEMRTVLAIVTAIVCALLAFFGGIWHLPERQIGWFESIAMYSLLAGGLDGALTMRTLRRESTGRSNPPPPEARAGGEP